MSKALRFRLAVAAAAFYALCILLPATALAFSEAPCLTEHHGFTQQNIGPQQTAHEQADHQHAGGADHHQHAATADHASPTATDGGNDQQPSAPKCCGIAFVAGVAPDFGFTLTTPVLAGRYGFAIKQALAGLPPDQLIRPPKSLS